MSNFFKRLSYLASLLKFERDYKKQAKQIEKLEGVPVTLKNGKVAIVVAPHNITINRLYVKYPDDEYEEEHLIDLSEIQEPLTDEVDNSFLYDDL